MVGAFGEWNCTSVYADRIDPGNLSAHLRGVATATSEVELEVKKVWLVELEQARTCTQISSCAKAAMLLCGGYRIAGADNDGIFARMSVRRKNLSMNRVRR